MKKHLILICILSIGIISCKNTVKEKDKGPTETTDIKTNKKDAIIDRFADLQVLEYSVPGLDKLSKQQQELVYYLTEAARCGRDIIYAQNYKHNIQIRRVLEEIYTKYQGNKSTDDWNSFEIYLKRVWFSNGIHHHNSEKKFLPGFSKTYFSELIKGAKNANWPLLEGENIEDMMAKLTPSIFDSNVDAKKVNKDKTADKVAQSANNYYGEGITEQEAVKFYKNMAKDGGSEPLSYGLNSRLIKKDGKLHEWVYSTTGLYKNAIVKMVEWLKKASTVAENEQQKKYIDLLIKYYETGDLAVWDECNVEWVKSRGDIDFIHGFIEVYGDALGYKASFESTIEITDFEASERMKVMANNVQWFEDHSSIMDEHKKKSVKGVSYKVVNVAFEGGDCAPSTPIGINLPNANWIRTKHGSKSVSLGNIVLAYNNASGSSSTKEFFLTKEMQERRTKHAKLSGKLHTAMHEVIGHASGKINDGIGQPNETLKNYSNTLEEARADLVALYFIYDKKLIDLGLIKTLEVGKAEYDGYIMNGMMLQLRRLEEGADVEEDHMRNRQLVAHWAYEKGEKDSVIVKKIVDGKTYFVVNDYEKLHDLFGQLLREIQRIKSEGDYASAETLVETYGVKADQALIKEVKERYKQFNLAPYSGFLQPNLIAEFDDNGNFISLKIGESQSFVEQMLYFSKNYSFLPNSGN